MAERPNAAVLKTAVLQGTGGSNPSSSEDLDIRALASFTEARVSIISSLCIHHNQDKIAVKLLYKIFSMVME